MNATSHREAGWLQLLPIALFILLLPLQVGQYDNLEAGGGLGPPHHIRRFV